MLSIEYLGAKLKDIRQAMDTTPQTVAGDEYLSHLRRLKEAYDREFSLAIKRPKKRKINPEERWAYYRKGIEPKHNFIFEPLEYVEPRNIERQEAGEKSRQVLRSMIHPQYANRFIREYILEP